jgi:hypothetical protein
MESFDEIRQAHIETLTTELIALAHQLIDLGCDPREVFANVQQQLGDQADVKDKP